MSSKLEVGDFRGAVRLVCFEGSIALQDDSTFEALKQKHLPSHLDTTVPLFSEGPDSVSIMVSEM